MNKKQLASKFLSLFDKFEDFYKLTNKKINANELIRKIESLFSKRVRLVQLLSLQQLSSKAKSIFNKKIEIPNWLTADTFSKGVRLFIKSKFDVTSPVNEPKKEGIKARSSSSKINLINGLRALVSPEEKNKGLSVSQTNKKNTSKRRLPLFDISLSEFSLHSQKGKSKTKAQKSLNTDESLKISLTRPIASLYKKIVKNIQSVNPLKGKRTGREEIRAEKDSQTVAIASYSDHFLTVARISINQNNQVIVRGVIEVPIPGSVIGDHLIEDTEELADIMLDLFNVLKLNDCPLLVILSSSLFKVHTFSSSELKQISNTDSKVQSKSPHLPADTFVEFRDMSKKTAKNKLLRTIYAKRTAIESWTNMLEIIDSPIIGITPAGPHIFDALTSKLSDSMTILIEIEITSTSVLFGRNLAGLTSHRIPYGCSLYVSNSTNDLSDNYFSRVLASIELIISEYDEYLPASIFAVGQGLDQLVKRDMPLPKGFKRASEIISTDYSYIPKRMEVHELDSKSIDSTIDTLSCIASSCL